MATLVLALMPAACGAPPHHGQPPSQGTPSVSILVVRPEPLTLTRELPGRVSPVLVSEVRPQVTGLIQSRDFVEGAEVKAGSLLYQIDPAPYRAALDSANAALAKAQSTLRLAQIKSTRYRELAAIRAVSQQDLDDADASVQQDEADVASAQAACETSRINLAYTRITAPVSGHIGRSSVTRGALVTASQTTALATIQKIDPVYVDLTQSSIDILRLRRAVDPGSAGPVSHTVQVRLLLEDGSVYALPGTLEFAEVTVDQSTGAVNVRALFPNPHAELLPGMYVRAIVTEAVESQALLIPMQAVSRDAGGHAFAFIVDWEGRLQSRPLTLGRAIGNRWVVTAGLEPGERLVVEGAQKAAPGDAVATVPYEMGADGRVARVQGRTAPAASFSN
jgi:membrane fusion protein (multidrug efflux system)